MNFTIILTNSLLEIVNSSIINKLYDLFITNMNSHVINLLGYLYSPSAYGGKVDELNLTYGPNLIITVPTSGRFIEFYSPATETAVKTALGISADTGITETDAADAIFTLYTFAGTSSNPNTSLTDFREFGYFTTANINPPLRLFEYCTELEVIDLSKVVGTSEYEFAVSGLSGDVSMPHLGEYNKGLNTGSFLYSQISTVSNLGSLITSIPTNCFKGCVNLTSVILPTSITSIGDEAFSTNGTTYSSKIFTTISGLDNVTRYDNRAFEGLSSLLLTTSDISSAAFVGYATFNQVHITGDLYLENLTHLDEYAFLHSRLSKIINLNAISSIPAGCFRSDDDGRNLLTEVYLPYNCTSIGSTAFQKRNGLTTLKIYLRNWTAQDKLDWIDNGTKPPCSNNLSGDPSNPNDGINVFGNYCFLNCSSLNLTEADLQKATTIGEHAFAGSAFSSSDLSIPNLTSLGDGAFLNCNIRTISNLGNIEVLSTGVFRGCSNLISAVIPNTLKECNANAFLGSLVKLVIMPEGVIRGYYGQPGVNTQVVEYIELPTTVTDMGSFFHNPYRAGTDGKIVVIKAINPPTLSYYKPTEIEATQRGVEKFSAIYVPSLSNYTTNPQGAWANAVVQGKLKAISDLEIDNPTYWAVYQSGLSNS